MLPPFLFVTGTDTGVGKTHVTRGLVRSLVRAGHSLFPLKLIETGCVPSNGVLQPEDGRALARALGREDLLDLVAPVRFELPAAPATAARRVGVELDFATLRGHLDRAASLASRLVVEGAGGLLVPIGPEGTFGDLAGALGARALVVARDALGTLNHTLLTVEAARRRGIEVAAVVLNATGPEPSPLEHRHELSRWLPEAVPVYGPLPWLPAASDDQLADALAGVGLDARSLLALAFG